MLPSESPFPCRWVGSALEIVGLGEVRPYLGTYGRYEFDRLPPLPFEMHGDLAWLAAAPMHDRCIGEEMSAENASALPLLQNSSARIRLRLPPSFVNFMMTPALHARIRSNTDCYLYLCPEPISSPIGGGYLVRFLADSQACVFWYLYITPDESDHAVVASPDFYGTAAEQWREEPPDPSEIMFCAESFDSFLCRFWLENEIWLAAYEKTSVLGVGLEYVENYRKKTERRRC